MVFLLVAAGYAVAAQAAWSLYGAAEIGASFFPAAGITVGAMLVLPTRRWSAVLAAIAVSETGINLLNGLSLGFATLYTGANAIEPLVGAVAVRALTRAPRPPFVDPSRAAGFAAFAAGALGAGPLAGAAVGAIGRAASSDDAWLPSVWSWWVGDALGVLAVGTALVLFADPTVRRRALSGKRPWLIVAAMIVALATLQVHVITPYLVIPVLMLVALFGGPGGAASVGLVTALVANLATALGAGAFAGIQGITNQEQLVDTQLLVGASLLAAYLLAVEVGERERAEAQRRIEHEGRVRAESMEAVGALSRDLTLARDLDGVVAALSHHLRTRLGAAALGVNLLDPDTGRFGDLVSEGFPQEVVERMVRLDIGSPFPGADAVRSGRPRFLSSVEEITRRYPEASDLARAADAGAAAMIPLNGHAGPVGYLALTWPAARAFDERERAYLGSVADVAGQSIERTRLMQRDHQLAVELQRAMLGQPDDLDGVTLATAYRPADSHVEVGGDWYDAIALPDGRSAFVVGDVVGHSLDAAKAMGQVRSAIRTLTPLFPEPDDLLARLEPTVIGTAGAAPTTLVYAVLDPRTHLLRYRCAGHLPPLLLPAAGGGAFLTEGRGAALGARTRVADPAGEVALEPGDTLVLYSDGLVERRGEPIDVGLERLRERATGSTGRDPGELSARLLRGLDRAHDDVALLVVRVTRPAFRSTMIAADPDELGRVRAELRSWLEGAGVGGTDLADVLVAAGEATANAVEHAYHGTAGGPVRVEADLDALDDASATIALAVHDGGRWRTPSAEGNRGRGEMLMRAMSDTLRIGSGATGTTVRIRRRVAIDTRSRAMARTEASTGDLG